MITTKLNDLIKNDRSLLKALPQLEEADRNLGCVDGRIIGTGRSDYTQDSSAYDLVVNDNHFALIDIPGIEGDETQFEQTIKNSLEQAHAIFYVNGSGKKIERATLEKIKKYMHDGTSVYAVFNVHCKGKKERIPGIDKTYGEELDEAYQSQQEILLQTETELKSFLGKNFVTSISINGLLSFCSLAMLPNGKTTIANEKDKNLRGDQVKYLKEYSQNTKTMKAGSRIEDVQSIITQKVEHFDEYIYEENIKKLKNRLREMVEKVKCLEDEEFKKIAGFYKAYDEFERRCNSAKDDCIHSINQIGYTVVAQAFEQVREELFTQIEEDKGKTKAYVIESIFEQHKEQLSEDIQNGVNAKINNVLEEYQEDIQETEDRLLKDFEREQLKFTVALSTDKARLDTSFENALKYSVKDFMKNLKTVGSLALRGAKVGAVIGAVIGGILGVLSNIWGFFVSKEKRINRAKEKLGEAINDQIDAISSQIKQEIKNLEIEAGIDQNFSEIQEQIIKQRKALKTIEQILAAVMTDLNKKYKLLQ